jgi:hypothetical protein
MSHRFKQLHQCGLNYAWASWFELCMGFAMFVFNANHSGFATHKATHNRFVFHVLARTYAAVRDLQVVEGVG